MAKKPRARTAVRKPAKPRKPARTDEVKLTHRPRNPKPTH
jgi:hypothetical protein